MSIIVNKYFTGEGMPKFKKIVCFENWQLCTYQVSTIYKIRQFLEVCGDSRKKRSFKCLPKTTTFFTRIATNPPKIVKLNRTSLTDSKSPDFEVFNTLEFFAH